MNKTIGFIFMLLVSASSLAERVGPSDLVVVAFEASGAVNFAISNNGVEDRCIRTSAWHSLKGCPANNSTCEAARNRMASMLLSAKLAGKQVSIERENCEVSRVDLRQ